MRATILQKPLLLFLPLLLAVSPLSFSTHLANEIVKKKTTEGQIIEIELITEGKISLYKFDRGSHALKLQAAYTPYANYFDYYVGYKDSYLVQKLGHENFQAILHRLLGRLSEWTHQFDIEKIKYEQIDRLILEFNDEYK